jgi:hypothetical protein
MTREQIEREKEWLRAQVDTLYADIRRAVTRLDYLNELLETRQYDDPSDGQEVVRAEE